MKKTKTDPALEAAHHTFLAELQSLVEDAAATLHRLAKIPTAPTEKFSASCAEMLTAINKEKDILSSLFSRLLAARSAYEEGRYKRRLRQQTDPDILFSAETAKKEPEVPTWLFSDDVEEKIHRLSVLLCHAEEALDDFALRAARSAKKVDNGSEKPTDYQTHIHFVRIRLHDLAIEAEHIRKELDHAKISSCS